MIDRLDVSSLRIPFRESFRHASAERSETSSLWVEATGRSGAVGYGESCPRPYVTGETLETAQQFCAQHEASVRNNVTDLASLVGWTTAHASAVDQHPAAWCALELAVLDLLAKDAGQTIEDLLSLPQLSGQFRYSAVIGDASPDVFRAAGERYRQHGFTDFKIKLSGDLARDRDKVTWLRQLPTASTRARADANNLWPDTAAATAYLASLDYPFFAVEEPIRANQYEECARIADVAGCQIVLDESFVRINQLPPLLDAPHRWLINLRVSKMGGLLRSLAIVDAARRAGIRLIVGAQVGETSLLTRAGLTVASPARDILVAQEGAFGTLLLERDVCDPPLMFGAGGVLDVSLHPSLVQPGTGVTLPR